MSVSKKIATVAKPKTSTKKVSTKTSNVVNKMSVSLATALDDYDEEYDEMITSISNDAPGKKSTTKSTKLPLYPNAQKLPTFQQQLIELGPMSNEDIKELIDNKTVVIVSNKGSHNYGPIGTQFKVNAFHPHVEMGGLFPAVSFTRFNGFGNNIMSQEFSVLFPKTYIDLEKELDRVHARHMEKVAEMKKEFERTSKDLKGKMKIVKDLNLPEYDEQLVKVLNSMNDIKTISQEEKLKIAKRLKAK